MNNKYDRDEVPKTHEEMVQAGYEMTGDGFWVPKEESEGVIEVAPAELADSVKLLLLLNGEQVITQLIDTIGSDNYTLRDPREVRLQSSSSDGETVTSTIGYSDWFPLSADREIKLAKSFVVSITRPLDSLLDSYIGALVDG